MLYLLSLKTLFYPFFLFCMNKTLKLFPLHRSFTDDNHNSYNDQHPSPFTCFVSKLLGKSDHPKNDLINTALKD